METGRPLSQTREEKSLLVPFSRSCGNPLCVGKTLKSETRGFFTLHRVPCRPAPKMIYPLSVNAAIRRSRDGWVEKMSIQPGGALILKAA